MKRSKVKNKANKPENPSDIKNYKKQRNYVLQLRFAMQALLFK